MIGKEMPLFLLMTGVNENVNDIINDKAMTFLSRSPKIELSSLGKEAIAFNYMNILGIDVDEAKKMSAFTNGYAFAYQVLGYFFIENKCTKVTNNLIKSYEQYLWANGYNKFWNDLTKNEKKFVVALAESKNGTLEEITADGMFKKDNYQQYRKRLLLKGIIKTPSYGRLEFVLPRFKEYILFVKDFD